MGERTAEEVADWITFIQMLIPEGLECLENLEESAEILRDNLSTLKGGYSLFYGLGGNVKAKILDTEAKLKRIEGLITLLKSYQESEELLAKKKEEEESERRNKDVLKKLGF
ncbi:hypothetical protein HNP93_000976 [Methanococcus maripaludis]|uniref:GimC subunit beta n=1 Tax=Methanococcus maripaludis TaxID=39152 RepID=A0A7J9P519_METMI|nr:hypothetical protein [Methanococcus maripaludis]MBA2858275.1 hypothetical protein [Methanococcus maripaludis]